MKPETFELKDKKIVSEWNKLAKLRDEIIAKANEAEKLEAEIKKIQGLIENRKSVLSPLVYNFLGDVMDYRKRLGDITEKDGKVFINVFDMIDEYDEKLKEKYAEFEAAQAETKPEEKK